MISNVGLAANHSSGVLSREASTMSITCSIRSLGFRV